MKAIADPGRLEKKSFCIEGVTSDAPSQCFSFHALIWRIVHAIGGTAMQLRVFGRSGMQLSMLGFGCGAVGGFMVRGDPADQERVIARAIAEGVNYFDTAVQYGDGESENNLGRVLRKLKPANVVVGTKVRIPQSEFGRIAEAVTTSLEGSLARLGLGRVDIFH